MDTNIAIHHYPDSFSGRWIKYFDKNNIKYKLVDCHAYDIIEQLGDIEYLLWSWNIDIPQTSLFAKELTYILEQKGITVIPGFKTTFFYDNKISQLYLLESIKAPFVKSYVFYEKEKAFDWIETATFPKVCKLSSGAGANGVFLCKNRQEAKRVVLKMFKMGFPKFSRIEWFRDNFRKFLKYPDLKHFEYLLRSFARLFIKTKYEYFGREKGYIYFQDFIPNNSFDIRVIVIGSRAVAIKRMCREGDFRASGSGSIIYEHSEIDIDCIDIAFKTNESIKAQYIAFDFVFESGKPLIVEISHYFSYKAYDKCDGYWSRDLKWHSADIDIPSMIIEETVCKKLNCS